MHTVNAHRMPRVAVRVPCLVTRCLLTSYVHRVGANRESGSSDTATTRIVGVSILRLSRWCFGATAGGLATVMCDRWGTLGGAGATGVAHEGRVL